ncbi:MAG: DUF2752 domain-containing protein [bacterium]|nr:DUF2752 domain-containing protein [bacterium]
MKGNRQLKKSRITLIREMDTEKGLYIIGLCALAVGLVLYLAAAVLGIDPFNILGERRAICAFYMLTGWYCPGCGGTRAFGYFLHGHFLKSIHFNAFVFYIMACYVIFMVSQTIRMISKNRYKGIAFHIGYIYIGVAIAVLQFVIKNGHLHSWF